jgi:hypothetical protein
VSGQLTCQAATVAKPEALRATLGPSRSLKRGRRLKVDCNKACTATAILVGAGKRMATGRARSSAAGPLYVPLKLTATARRRLSARHFVRGRLTLTVTDADGGRAVLRRTLKIVG